MSPPKPRFYTATATGKRYPVEEAVDNYPLNVYRVDQRRALEADPAFCIIALGAKRDPEVEDVFIGAGRDAYICFKATPDKPAHAKHYVLNKAAADIRNYFDQHHDCVTQQLILLAPTAGRTLAHRSTLNQKRRVAIKNGEHTPKKRGPINPVRITRLGGRHRPRPILSR